MLEAPAILKGLEKIAPFSVWIYDIRAQKNIYVSSVDHLDYTPEELREPKNFVEHFVHPEDQAKIYTYQASFKNMKEGEVGEVTYRFRLKTGEYVHFEDKNTIFKKNSDGTVEQILGVTTPVERFIRLAEEVKIVESQKQHINHSSRMAAIGEMATGIAHETNNPLSVIKARAFQITENLQTGSFDPGLIQKCTESILSSTERIAKIVRTLKSFARQGKGDPMQIVSVKELIETAVSLCEGRFLKAGIPIQTVVDASEGQRLLCRRVEIEQVFVNLLNNSFDAIAASRSLLAETTQVSHEPEKVEIEVIPHRFELEFRIRDSGERIPEMDQDNLMKPFFTTKAMGQGTGLGLSVSSSIVRDHEGLLYHDPAEKLTTFVVKLPKKI